MIGRTKASCIGGSNRKEGRDVLQGWGSFARMVRSFTFVPMETLFSFTGTGPLGHSGFCGKSKVSVREIKLPCQRCPH